MKSPHCSYPGVDFQFGGERNFCHVDNVWELATLASLCCFAVPVSFRVPVFCFARDWGWGKINLVLGVCPVLLLLFLHCCEAE